ncbi:DUF1684 domain-containing protein [Flavicella sediminum]|uniref:DUF1684 domain-containing protein n=1 Tax=Flavicella sediminum TaxID=2585141 RepID=UPI00111D0943|nr:DUF1684 domain-containing protein [Flavicella sediminum]
MKKIVLLICFLSTVTAIAQDAYTKKITAFQEKLIHEYATKDSSPLTKKDLSDFKALPFFKIDKKYKILASLQLTPEAPMFPLTTSTKRKPLYRQYAIARFIIDGAGYQLSIYRSQDSKMNPEYQDYLFLPFKDLTNGESSYGAGRYIDVFISDIVNNQIIIDFNKAYNPYCAYNYKYSCPIPPAENHLDIAIEAGVKNGILKK